MPKNLREERDRALSMRIEGRMSLGEIQAELGVSRGSLSSWLRAHPLSEEERFKKQKARTPFHRSPNITQDVPSNLWKLCRSPARLTSIEKGRIAEAAVLLRLAVLGLTPYQSAFEGGSYDYLVQLPSKEIRTFQVRWARQASRGSPTLSLHRSHGRGKTQRYMVGDLDFLVGYDLYGDVAYVFNWAELGPRTQCISLHPQAAEAWEKVLAPR